MAYADTLNDKRKSAIIRTRLAIVFGLILLSATAARAQDTAPVAPTRADFIDPKFRAGTFRHMDNLYPSHVIHRAAGPATELPRAERALDVSYSFAGKQHTLDDFLERTRATGFIVLKDGKVVTERYFDGADKNSKFTSWSVGKSFTSTLVGLAIADGKIAGVDSAVTDYVPELKGSGYDGVPIKYILEMSSGIKFTEVYGNAASDIMIMWRRTMSEESERLDHYAASLTRFEPPGSRFEYRSVDTQVLGELVKKVTGETLADNLSKRIWQPIGMESDATWLTDRPGPDGMEAAFCCINATLRDWARFGLLFMHKGNWNGKQIVPASWVGEATSPHGRQVQFGRIIKGSPNGYGYQWWLLPGAAHEFSAEGVFFQFIYVDPANNVVIAKTSALDDFWDEKMEDETWVAYRAVGESLKKY